jgi:hypothetical protein
MNKGQKNHGLDFLVGEKSEAVISEEKELVVQAFKIVQQIVNKITIKIIYAFQ